MNFLELAKYVGPKQSIADVMETFNVSYFVAARARDIFRFRQEQPGKKILVVPDCHVEVGQDLSRFKLLTTKTGQSVSLAGVRQQAQARHHRSDGGL